ncbi:hypothetical protein MMC22_002579 [Lobaria immixta]|nr:hypothetical protein [Lobaria immixta]
MVKSRELFVSFVDGISDDKLNGLSTKAQSICGDEYHRLECKGVNENGEIMLQIVPNAKGNISSRALKGFVKRNVILVDDEPSDPVAVRRLLTGVCTSPRGIERPHDYGYLNRNRAVPRGPHYWSLTGQSVHR